MKEIHDECLSIDSRNWTDSAKTFARQTLVPVMKYLKECCSDDEKQFASEHGPVLRLSKFSCKYKITTLKIG